MQPTIAVNTIKRAALIRWILIANEILNASGKIYIRFPWLISFKHKKTRGIMKYVLHAPCKEKAAKLYMSMKERHMITAVSACCFDDPSFWKTK